MTIRPTSNWRSIVEAARTELVGHGRIVGVAMGETDLLKVLVSEAQPGDRAYAERWGASHGIGIDMKVIGAVVLI